MKFQIRLIACGLMLLNLIMIPVTWSATAPDGPISARLTNDSASPSFAFNSSAISRTAVVPAGTLDHHIYLPIIWRSQVYYVAPTGNDANPGTFNAPWHTLQKAVNTASPGSTIYARGGTYAGFDLLRSELVIAGYPGETAVVEGNSTRTNTIKIRNVTDVAIMNLTVQDSPIQYGAAIDAKAVSNLSVAGNVLRNNQSFGLNLENVSDSVIQYNDISSNGTGIEVEYGGSGVVIQNNLIHDNLTLVDSGRGKDGINVYSTTLPTLISNNTLWNNGKSFELYNSSNLTFTQNLAYDGSVLETGTDPGGSCDHITFTRNLAWKSSTLNRYADGLILRCASHSLIANNTFDGLDAFAFDIVDGTLGTEFGGSIEGLTIENNIVVNGRAYSLDSVLPASVVIDHNLAYGTSNARFGEFFAYVAGHGNTSSLADLQSWTGYDLHGLSADPLFVDQTTRNYYLAAASPAIDQGVILSDPYNGAAPDLGRYEYP